jgi:uncharacterized protein YbjT (DUF2867 family)
VRTTSRHEHLKRTGVEIAFADLTDPSTLDSLCANVDVVIATANAATPRTRADSFRAVDEEGYKNLIDACLRQRVGQFVYASVVAHPDLDKLPISRAKRLTEARLRESGLPYTVFRADAFMDVHFSMMGSDLPVQGAEAATVQRPFWFSTRFFQGVKHDMIQKGTAGVLGDGLARRSYVCIDDMAEFLVRAVGHPSSTNAVFDVGGPEALSQKEVVRTFEKVLGRPLVVKHAPAVIFRIGRYLLAPFSPAAANIMGLNYVSTYVDSVIDMTETARLFGVQLTSAEQFLRHKLG